MAKQFAKFSGCPNYFPEAKLIHLPHSAIVRFIRFTTTQKVRTLRIIPLFNRRPSQCPSSQNVPYPRSHL